MLKRAIALAAALAAAAGPVHAGQLTAGGEAALSSARESAAAWNSAYSMSISGGGHSFSSSGGGDIATVDVTPKSEGGKGGGVGGEPPAPEKPLDLGPPYTGSWRSAFLALFLVVPTLALSPALAAQTLGAGAFALGAAAAHKQAPADLGPWVRDTWTEGCARLIKRFS